VIVVDANVVVYYAIPGPRTPLADRLREADPDWHAPLLWRSEVRNVLAGLARRGEMDLGLAVELMEAALGMLGGREYEVDSAAVLERSVRSGCTAYDCEYVVLAEELGVRLVTVDRQVLRAFPKTAVALEDLG
jgi:predicted nucleic acid-binding protein